MSRNNPLPPSNAPGTLRLLKAGFGFFQPDLWVVDETGTPRVWKSWARRPAWECWLVDRRLAKREGRILAALSDVDGFPRFLGHPSDTILEMTMLDAEEVPEIKGGGTALNAQYFDSLWSLLQEMHSRGINHGDLRRKNLLRAPGDPSTPRMVDFTQSFYFPPPRSFLTSMLFKRAVRVDRVTFLKLKKWFIGPEAMTEEELLELDQIPWYLTLGRFLRKRIYRPIRRKLKKRK